MTEESVCGSVSLIPETKVFLISFNATGLCVESTAEIKPLSQLCCFSLSTMPCLFCLNPKKGLNDYIIDKTHFLGSAIFLGI